MINAEEFSKRVKGIRVKHGLTKSDMADELEISFKTYASMEKGKFPKNIKFLYMLQDKFDVDLDEFLELEITY